MKRVDINSLKIDEQCVVLLSDGRYSFVNLMDVYLLVGNYFEASYFCSEPRFVFSRNIICLVPEVDFADNKIIPFYSDNDINNKIYSPAFAFNNNAYQYMTVRTLNGKIIVEEDLIAFYAIHKAKVLKNLKDIVYRKLGKKKKGNSRRRLKPYGYRHFKTTQEIKENVQLKQDLRDNLSDEDGFDPLTFKSRIRDLPCFWDDLHRSGETNWKTNGKFKKQWMKNAQRRT